MASISHSPKGKGDGAEDRNETYSEDDEDRISRCSVEIPDQIITDLGKGTEKGNPPPPQGLYAQFNEWFFPKEPPKFGTFSGVFARCLLNIWGVIMFLRLGWMVAHAGLWWSISIVAVAMLITTITTLSLSAICTNGIIGGGGAYFLLSRSLGPAFGGSIGVLFSLANATAVALHLVGFAETITTLIKKDESSFTMTDGAGDGLWDLRIWAFLCLIFLMGVGLVGVSYVVKLQLNFLWLLIVSLVCYFIGTLYSADPSYAFTGYQWSTLEENMKPGWEGESWITLFAVFFPASTGIMAGANISGDLKDAQRSIPKGTLWAVGVSGVTYVVMLFTIACTVTRGNFTTDDPDAHGEAGSSGVGVGTYNDYLVMYDMSAWPPSIIIGIVASALSSALAALVGAPRVFQAVCEDGLFPAMTFMGVTTKVSGGEEPLRAYALTFVIAVCVIMIGDLNAIAPYITNFFMISYALINYACFVAAYNDAPGWRPKWKWYNKWVALFGSFSCIGAMVMISWYTGIITIIIAFLLYKYVDYSPINKNWGNVHRSLQYQSAVTNVYKLEKSYRATGTHMKNYRPAYLVLSGPVHVRDDLIKFVQQLRYGGGVTVSANILVGDFQTEHKKLLQARAQKYYSVNKFSCVPMAVCAPTLLEGWRTLLQTAGVGVLSPNTVVLNFKTDHGPADGETKDGANASTAATYDEFVQFLADALGLNYAFIMLKGYSHSKATNEREMIPLSLIPGVQHGTITNLLATELNAAGVLRPAVACGVGGAERSVQNPLNDYSLGHVKKDSDAKDVGCDGSKTKSTIIRRVSSTQGTQSTFARLPGIFKKQFSTPQSRTGRIDVYWLCDHGGLSILLPFILKKNPTWSKADIRVLVPLTEINTSDGESGAEGARRQNERLTKVLGRLRIEATTKILPRCPELDICFCHSDNYSRFYEELDEAVPDSLGKKVFDSPKSGAETKNAAPNGVQIDMKRRFADIVAAESSDACMVFMTAPHPDPTHPKEYMTLVGSWTDKIDVPVAYIHGSGDRVMSIEA